MLRRSPVALVAALAVCAPASALAAVPAAPLTLPGDASAAGVRAEPSSWIVGARPGAAAARLARAYGARHTGPAGSGGYVLARGRARAFAAALRSRGLLNFAEPNVLRRGAAMPVDPLDAINPWRTQVVDPTLTPPVVSATSPLIALVDASADTSHPDLRPNVTKRGNLPVRNLHGTATASVAAAPANGVGLSGVWPGARALNVALDESISCVDSADGIAKAITAAAAVINMSYGSADVCFDEYVALQFAVANDIVPVAAAGNEFAEGNPLEYPASLPHVMTVGAVGRDDEPSFFSNTSVAMDVAAPGEDISAAVPPALDPDAVRDGYASVSGTSFAAPMVSAGIAWIRADRPSLRGDQAADLVRYNARDVGTKGYDASTGFGVLNVRKALEGDAGPHDPGEPNDDIDWVDGREFGRADPVLYKGRGRAKRLRATVDETEDPYDVYRVRARGHRRVKVTANPSYGNITLTAFSPRTRSTAQRKRRVARSARRGGRTERITIRNRSRRARVYFVAIEVARGSRLDAGYVLRAAKGRRATG